MEDFIKDICIKHDLHDIDLIVIKHNKIVNEVIYSNPNIEIKIMKRDDLYRIASISKIFVGIAIMQLVEIGKLSLDDNIENYIGFSLKNKNHPNDIITIKHLLTHTSSLKDTEHRLVPYPEHSEDLFTKNGKYYSEKMFSTYKPGETFIYYNAGFHLLAMIIEHVSQLRFDQYIKRYILDPLSMKGSFNVSDINTSNHIRPLFRKLNDKWTPKCDYEIHKDIYDDYKLGTNGSLFSPQGGMRSNAKELSKLMFDLMSNTSVLLSTESLDYMYQIHYFDNHKNLEDKHHFYRHSGIVFNIINDKSINKPLKKMDYTLIGHCGLAYGFHGMFFFDKKNRNGFIFNVTGEGKDMKEYMGSYSQYFSFQEELLTYIDQHVWSKNT